MAVQGQEELERVREKHLRRQDWMGGVTGQVRAGMRTHCETPSADPGLQDPALDLGACVRRTCMRREGTVCRCSEVVGIVPNNQQSLTALTLMVESRRDTASSLPSGLKVTHMTQSSWPLSVCMHAPVAASHTLTVVSKLPLAMRWLSDAIATQYTLLACPSSVRRSVKACEF